MALAAPVASDGVKAVLQVVAYFVAGAADVVAEVAGAVADWCESEEHLELDCSFDPRPHCVGPIDDC